MKEMFGYKKQPPKNLAKLIENLDYCVSKDAGVFLKNLRKIIVLRYLIFYELNQLSPFMTKT